MTTITGTVKNSSNVGIAGKVVRAYRRDTGDLLGQGVTSDGVTPNQPVCLSATLMGVGPVSTNDLVLLFLVNPSTLVSAPTGWTRIADTTDNEGNKIMVFKSLYAAANAAVNTTNFPVGLGYFLTMVYAGSCTVPQVGAFTHVVAGNATVTAPALTNPTTTSSALVGWASSRGPSNTSITASNSMVSKLQALSPTYFDGALFESLGVQSGTRQFTRNGDTSFSLAGILLEVQNVAAPLALGDFSVHCGTYAGDAYLVMMAGASDKNSQIKDWRTAA